MLHVFHLDVQNCFSGRVLRERYFTTRLPRKIPLIELILTKVEIYNCTKKFFDERRSKTLPSFSQHLIFEAKLDCQLSTVAIWFDASLIIRQKVLTKTYNLVMHNIELKLWKTYFRYKSKVYWNLLKQNFIILVFHFQCQARIPVWTDKNMKKFSIDNCISWQRFQC